MNAAEQLASAERGMERPLREYGWFQALCALPFVDAIWLFGSRARGYAWDRSDIDIAIHSPTAGWAEWQKVLDIVEEADTLMEIDVVRFDELRPGDEFRASIERKHIELFRR